LGHLKNYNDTGIQLNRVVAFGEDYVEWNIPVEHSVVNLIKFDSNTVGEVGRRHTFGASFGWHLFKNNTLVG